VSSAVKIKNCLFISYILQMCTQHFHILQIISPLRPMRSNVLNVISPIFLVVRLVLKTVCLLSYIPQMCTQHFHIWRIIFLLLSNLEWLYHRLLVVRVTFLGVSSSKNLKLLISYIPQHATFLHLANNFSVAP